MIQRVVGHKISGAGGQIHYATTTYVYNEMERIVDSIEGVNTLLVSTQNLGELSDAYPKEDANKSLM